jgi:hypothetical protein
VYVLAFIGAVTLLATVALWLLFPRDDLDLGELDDRAEFDRVMDRHIADRLTEWDTHRDLNCHRGNQ